MFGNILLKPTNVGLREEQVMVEFDVTKYRRKKRIFSLVEGWEFIYYGEYFEGKPIRRIKNS